MTLHLRSEEPRRAKRGSYWNEEFETKPWREVEAWQAERVTAFVKALPARSELYRDRLSSRAARTAPHDSLAFLADLPFTSKDDLRLSQECRKQGQPFGRNQAAPLDAIVQTLSSSGTTGHPVYYALTERDLGAWADAIAAAFFTAGIRSDDIVAHLVGLPIVAGGLPYADGFRRIGATLAWLGGLPTERILASLPRLQATAVLSTTSFATYLADQAPALLGKEADTLGIRKILAGGEPGLGQPEIRQKIRDGWRVEHVRETMGLADVLSSIWAECDDEGGMHFCAQRDVAIELIDPASGVPRRWEDGANGEIVYTTFSREATPVLRFRSADHVLVTGVGCRCGRTSPRIRCVGRTDDMLIYKGMNVFPTAIRDVVLTRFSDAVAPYLRVWKDFPGQVRYDDPIPVDVEAGIGLATEAYAGVAERIEAELRARLQVRTTVSVLAPGTLPRSSYKTPLIHVRDEDVR